MDSAKLENAPHALLPSVSPDPDKRYEPFPLTDVQQAYWIGRGAAVELGNVSTHGYQEFDLVGLDLEKFEFAWQKVIERHDMLRAIVRPDGLQQILKDVPPYRIKILDLRHHSAQRANAELQSVRDEISHQVLPCDQWPMFEVRVSQLGDDRFRIHLSVDCLTLDLWSIEILRQELARLYRDPQTVLGPLELSFRDYVLAEEGLRDTELYQRALTYWQERLTTLPPAPELPLARAASSLQQPHFVRKAAQLEKELWKRLKARANQAGLTPSGVLLAAFAEVLKVWSKSGRFTINLTLFNRMPLHAQVNDIVGDFTSLTLLEIDNSSKGTFEELGKRIQEQLWKDLDHRYVSGVRVLREMAKVQGGLLRAAMPVVFTSGLFESSVNQEDVVQEASSSSDVLSPKNRIYSITQTPQVWLDHQVGEQEGKLVFNWDVVEELFPAGVIDEMFRAYCRLVRRLAEEEGVWQESTAELVPVPEKQLEKRAAVNATEKKRKAGVLLHTMFEEQAERRAEQVAVISRTRQLSYGELEEGAEEIGRWLKERGAGRNQLVGVVMEKGWEQIAGVMGVLKSGGAYLPIAAELPQERVEYLLKHGEVKLVVTQSWVESRIEWPEGVERLSVDEVMGEEAGGGEERRRRRRRKKKRRGKRRREEEEQKEEDLAYVIYTSGSTGLPKGVMIDHRGAVNTILDMNERFGVGEKDRVLGLSSLSFDLSVYDIFGVLGGGGTVVVPEAEGQRDPGHWLEMMREHGVSVWDTVPALMEMLVEYVEGKQEKLPESVRLVLMSGDWIGVGLPERIRGVGKEGIRVVSLGGATEASIWSIVYEIGEVEEEWSSIPYGLPMENQKMYVLGEGQEERPEWVTGEIYIGGVGLARGYWRDEEKSRASFMEAEGRGGERLYRTGDLGRYRGDGTIEFLGREDFQVKIGGHRIELGEIEAVLGEHPWVKGAVVAAIGERTQRRLVGYYVRGEEQEQEQEEGREGGRGEEFEEELRNFLRQKLPEYMVPGMFVELEKLPLTSNGKVNRQGLPLPEMGTGKKWEHVGPRTEVEKALVEIWGEVLGVEQVGVYDDFFRLGGDSVQAMRILVQIHRRFQVDLPFRNLLESATVAGWAKEIEGRKERGGGEGVESLPMIEAGRGASVRALCVDGRAAGVLDREAGRV